MPENLSVQPTPRMTNVSELKMQAGRIAKEGFAGHDNGGQDKTIYDILTRRNCSQ